MQKADSDSPGETTANSEQKVKDASVSQRSRKPNLMRSLFVLLSYF